MDTQHTAHCTYQKTTMPSTLRLSSGDAQRDCKSIYTSHTTVRQPSNMSGAQPQVCAGRWSCKGLLVQPRVIEVVCELVLAAGFSQCSAPVMGAEQLQCVG
jgi:hypothetical protein